MRSEGTTGPDPEPMIDAAVEWGAIIDEAGISNYERLVSELNRIRCRYHRSLLGGGDVNADELMIGAKSRLMRERDMPGRAWPVLLRLAIMDYPQLASVVRPGHLSIYDDQRGRALLALAAKSVSGRRPQIRCWEMAAHA